MNVAQTRPSNLWRWLVVGLCLLSFGKGVWDLGEQSLWWDESLSHYRATRSFGFILSNRMTFINGDHEVPITPDNHPPLYFVLLRLVLLAAGESEFALRFLSLAVGVLLVPLLYQTGRWLYGTRAGVWAAALGALSPLYLWAQQEARPYALLTGTALLAFYALLRAVQPRAVQSPADALTKRPDPVGRPARWIFVALAATAAMLVTHYHGFLLLPALGTLLLFSRRRWHRRDFYLLGAGGALLVLLTLWALRALPEQAEIPGYVALSLGTLLRDVFRATPLGLTGTATPMLRSLPFEWFSAALLLVAALILGTSRRPSQWRPALYLLAAFALPVTAIQVLSHVRPAYMNIRHLIIVSPFYFLMLGAAVASARWAWMRLAMALCVVLLVAGMLLSTQAYLAAYLKEDHRGWGHYLSQHVRPDDLVLINPGASAQLYFYYVDSPARWYGFPLLNTGSEDTLQQIAELAAINDRLWIAQSMTPHWANPGDLAREWLRDNAMRLEGDRFYSANTTVLAELFQLEPALLDTLPGDTHPVPLDFGERLSLLGTRATSDAVVTGETLQLSFYWSALEPLDQAYRMTVSLKDDRGRTWLQMDRAPYSGAYPTDRWPGNRIVRDDLDVEIPLGTPPGRYWLSLSVYGTGLDEPALPARDRTSGRLQGLIVPVTEVQVIAPVPGTPAQLSLADEIPTLYKRPYRYGAIALLGYSTKPGTLYPGDVINLDAYWQARRTPRSDAAFALQLQGPDGAVYASRAVSPADSYAPTMWHRGQVVRGQYHLRIPVDAPPGDYTCHIVSERGRFWRSFWPGTRAPAQLCQVTVRAPDAARSFEVPAMQHTLGINLNDEVELLGYDLEADQEATGKVGAGEAVQCTLYWRALQTMERNYTVFTHLVAADGRTWGQWDNQPQGGQSPTTRWAPGQVIADPYRIPVSADAPAVPVELRVGMYDRHTMLRLPVYDADGQIAGDHIALTELEVTHP